MKYSVRMQEAIEAIFDDLLDDWNALRKQHDRLRAALERYADHKNWSLMTTAPPSGDGLQPLAFMAWLGDAPGWQTAERALKGEP